MREGRGRPAASDHPGARASAAASEDGQIALRQARSGAAPESTGWSPARKTLVNALVLVGAAAALVTRRLDAFTNPQFWAEDGALFYAQAYGLGRQALLLPYAGYYQTVSRLVAAVAVSFPLSWGPGIMNGAGFLIQLLPVLFLLGGRLDHLVTTWAAKLLLILMYVAIPYSSELFVDLTDAQWHLALLAVMVVVAARPGTWAGRAFDVAALVLSGISGPFAILLLPLLLVRLVVRREPWTAVLTIVTGLCALLQGATLLTTSARRLPAVGFHPHLIAIWVGGQIGAGTVLGAHGYRWASGLPHWYPAIVSVAALATCGLGIWAAWRGPLEIRLLVLWAVLLVVSVFAARGLGPQGGSWMVTIGTGNRYRMLPSFVLVAVLVWLAGRLRGWQKVIPGALIATTLLVAGPLDWVYPPFQDYHFQRQARLFDMAPPGTEMVFRLNPAPWTMTLVKRR